MAYDPIRERVVLYAAATTWEWDGTSWSDRMPATQPPQPPAIDEVVMRALQPEVSGRYQRAEEMLTAILSARQAMGRRSPAGAPIGHSGPGAARSGHPVSAATPPPRPVTSDARGPEPVANRFCWHCRKPLPSRAARCPFCGESQ
jgi:hypothetical protein